MSGIRSVQWGTGDRKSEDLEALASHCTVDAGALANASEASSLMGVCVGGQAVCAVDHYRTAQ